MSGSLVARADSAVGAGIEAAVRLKHRRRLARLGWSHALDPPDCALWSDGDPPPRPNCSIELLVDGAEALPKMAEAMMSTQHGCGRFPRRRPPRPRTVQVVRPIAEGMYDRVPRGDFSILESHTRALRSAERLVYLENQFLWAPEIVAILAEKLRHP